MRKVIGFCTSLILSFAISCNNEQIEPFQLSINDSNYSLAYSLLYQLSDQKLVIIYRGGLENEKDSILYSTTELPKAKLRKISAINIDSLKTSYRNRCIDDGDIKTFSLSKNGKTKTIHLSNYYHPELSPTIELINQIVPKKYQMHYDMEDLITEMKNCEENVFQ